MGGVSRPRALPTLWLLHALVFGQAAVQPKVGKNEPFRLQLRWAQTNTTVTVAVNIEKQMSCNVDSKSKLAATWGLDRLFFSAVCEDSSDLDSFRWEYELREDIVEEESKLERPAVGGLLLVLKKKTKHVWDRLLWNESFAAVSKDWKREDRNLPEEDEVEMPRAFNIKQYGYESLVEAAGTTMLVLAMRYPWCGACAEKDQAFVKASKKVHGNAVISGVQFGSLDLRENKAAARRWNATCKKDHCPLFVFKPDEPLDEPYAIEMRLLYEMDEYSMMSDPMAGAPGHTPKGQTVKPDFARFESDLSLLMSAAVTPVHTTGDIESLRDSHSNVVVGVGIAPDDFRRTARRLRGVATFAFADKPLLPLSGDAGNSVGEASIHLWAKAATASRTPLLYPNQLDLLNISELEQYVLIHSEPLMQNYTWDLKGDFERIGLPVSVLWVNYSDVNSTNVTQRALEAFTSFCDKRRGTNASFHVICCVNDESYAYYQRDYGNHEPYPYPYFGLTKKLGFGEGDRYGYLFKEPQNETVRSFFSKPKKAAKDMSSWVSKVLSGQVPVSHESGTVPSNANWVRGTVQEAVWKTYQKEINGSTADTLLELYDGQRKKAHIGEGTMRVIAVALKDYSSLKIARMETAANYVPPIFDRKQYSKETEYYWVPPSIVSGELTHQPPVRYTGSPPITPEKLLNFLKKHTLTSWSLKEALEVSSDISPEILGQARSIQREDDSAEEEKQRMIKKMMSSLKKEKGLVDVGEMMGYKKAAETVGVGENEKDSKDKKKDMTKKEKKASKKERKLRKEEEAKKKAEDEETRRQERREKLKKDEDRMKKAERKDKEKRKQRKEADKRRQADKKKKEAEGRAKQAKDMEKREKARKLKEQERRMAPTTPYFAWGQSREEIRITVSIPSLKIDGLNVTVTNDSVAVRAQDHNGRSFTLGFEMREFIVAENSSWVLRHSEEAKPKPDGVNLELQKAVAHRWDRLAQNYSAIKPFMKKDWVQDDGDLDEEHEDIDLPSGTNIKKVTAGALAKLTASNTMVVAALRYPWCDKCKEKDKHFAKAAKTTKDKDLIGSIIFAVVDVREDKHLGRQHNATCDDGCDLLIFKQDEPGEPYTVPGRRYHEEIQIDCYKHLLPAVNEVGDKETLDRVTSAFDTAIVGFFRGSKQEDEWYPRFRAAARELRGHALFGAIFGDRDPRDFGIERDAAPSTVVDDQSSSAPRPLILLFKPKEKRHVEFTGELSLDTLTHFSRVLSLPLISTYEFETRQKYQELKVPLGQMWLDADRPDCDENAQAKRILNRLAIRFSGNLVFVMLNSTRDGLMMRPMGLDPRRAPSFGIARRDELESDRFGFDMQGFTRQERAAFWADEEQAYSRFESFCQSFLDDTLEVSHESAELPKSYSWYGPGVVHEVVWKTFRESAYRTEHDVLLELYSPFRPQHRTYVTVLELVAEALANVTTLKVARMDTANNYILPEFGVKMDGGGGMGGMGGMMGGGGGSDKEKASTFFFIPAAPEKFRRPKRFGGRGGKAEGLPEKLLRYVHREMSHADEPWDLDERVRFVSREANRRIKRLKSLEKDYEKKMQEEWMQKEMEEFERYKRNGKFDNIPEMGR